MTIPPPPTNKRFFTVKIKESFYVMIQTQKVHICVTFHLSPALYDGTHVLNRLVGLLFHFIQPCGYDGLC